MHIQTQTPSELAQALQEPTLKLSQTLMARPSVTPNDVGCQEIISQQLAPHGFVAEYLHFGDANQTGQHAQVKNLWLRRGQTSPVFCFAGHTDVVPTGDVDNWRFDPFTPTLADGHLWGRGAADMKTAIAAFVVATDQFINDYPNHQGSIAMLITSDEEGPSINGTVKVIDTLEARQEKIDYCLVGEPSSTDVLGDVIKNGRRGSLGGVLTVTGKQGHVAYPHLAVNPIHEFSAALDEFIHTQWDNGNDHFPATSMQLSNINAGTGANNVIPKTLTAVFNFRFSTKTNADALKQQTHAIFDKHFANSTAQYAIDWQLSGNPFLTAKGELVVATQAAIKAELELDTQLSTAGGTSDGRFIAPTGAQVVELGVRNATIHQVNEKVEVNDLGKLAAVYYQILCQLLVR